MSQYWLICVPNEKDPQRTRGRLEERTKLLSSNNTFKLPDNPPLKVGTIDQLMQLSDELNKIDQYVEATVKKIERTCVDVVKSEVRDLAEKTEKDAATTGATSAAASAAAAAANTTTSGGKENKAGPAAPAADLRVERILKDGSIAKLAPEKALEDFVWDIRRFHSSKGISTIADGILKSSTRADDDLKNKLAEFSDLKQNVQAAERKEGGSLLVRSLGPYVKKSDIYETEYLTTLLVVVPKAKEAEFVTSYEYLEEQAIKRDAEREADRKQKVAEDAKRKADNDKAKKDKDDLMKKKAVHASLKKDDKHEKHHEEPKESEEEKKRREDEKKREEEEKALEEKKKEDERAKKEKEERKRLECRNVVPGSAKKLVLPGSENKKVQERSSSSSSTTGEGDDDDEFVLYRIVVMKKGADSYRNLCRDKRWTVRPFKYDPDEDKSQKDKRRTMEQQKANLFRSIVGWCNVTFSDLFNAWLHIKAMRIFVEAVLRYGLPIDFQAILLKPKKGTEKKLRDALGELYSKLSGDSSLADQLEAGDTDLSGMGADFYSYVYLPITLTDWSPTR